MKKWDVIVLGLGGAGSSVLYHLARQGLTVLGLDQYPEAHPFGSSHGQTRIVRQAYFEGPFFSPLKRRVVSGRLLEFPRCCLLGCFRGIK